VRGAAACLLFAACGFSTPASTPSDGKLADGQGNGSEPAPLDAALDAPPDAASCPGSFVAIPAALTGSRYLAFAKDTQLGALATCAGLNTHLLHLDSQAEATELETYIDQQTGSGDTRLYRVVGARDLVFRNVWHELDVIHTLTFLPWGTGEPTDQIGEDCIVLKTENSSGVIGADQCVTLHEFACECD